MTASDRSSRALLGVNLPWFFGAYGHDMAPNERHPDWGYDFRTFASYKPLVEARDMGFAAIRVWLCENAEGIVTTDGRVSGVRPELLESVKVVQECAALAGLRVYWTLLDGNSFAREGDLLSRAILSDPDEGARFAEHVVRPLVRMLDPKVSLALEVVNEPEAMTQACMKPGEGEPVEWEALGRTIRTVGDAARAERSGTIVTAGTLHVFLPQLWRAGGALDAVDIHMYHETAGLPSRADLAEYVGDARIADPSLTLIAGECGIPDEAPADAITELPNYLSNADALGYDAAFIWRLEQVLLDPKDPKRALTPVGRDVRKMLRARG